MKKLLLVALCLVSISVYAINPKSNGEPFTQDGLTASIKHNYSKNIVVLDEEITVERNKVYPSEVIENDSVKKKPSVK